MTQTDANTIYNADRATLEDVLIDIAEAARGEATAGDFAAEVYFALGRLGIVIP